MGRKEDHDINEDEQFVVVNEGEQIPNDPSRPRVKGPDLDKALDRFKYEPETKPDEQDELIIPIDVKPLPKP